MVLPTLGGFCPPEDMVCRRAPAIHPSSRSRLSTAGADALFLPATGRVNRPPVPPARTAYQGATLMKILASAACVLLLLGASASAQALYDPQKNGHRGPARHNPPPPNG